MNAFDKGFISVLKDRGYDVDGIVKQAQLGLIADPVNTLANIKVLTDMTNDELDKKIDPNGNGVVGGVAKNNVKAKPRKLSVEIDPALFSKLSPEERKRLFFAIRKIKVG